MYTGRWLHHLNVTVSHGSCGIDPKMQDERLAKLRAAQWVLREEEDLMPYVEAIEAATPETLELARPQLYQAFAMIREAMRTRHFQHDYFECPGLLTGKTSAADMVPVILEQTAREGQEHLRWALRQPGHEESLRGITAALTILADAKEVVSALALGGGSAESGWLREAETAFAALAAGAERLRDGVGKLYEEAVHALVPAPAAIDAGAAERVRAALSIPTPDLTTRRLEQGYRLTGLWEPGFRMLNKKGPKEEPLAPERIEELRALAAGVLADYDAVFHRPGFVNLLRQAAVMARHEAMHFVDVGTVGDVAGEALAQRHAAERAYAEGRYRFKSDAMADINKPLKERERSIRGHERWMLREARGSAVLAESVEAFLARAAQAVGLETPTRCMRLDQVGDVAVLRFADERPGDTALAVYPDPHESYADAVYAVILDAERLTGGVPPLAALRAQGEVTGTNFPNMEDLLVSLRDSNMQERAFGGPVAIEKSRGVRSGARPDPLTATSRGRPAPNKNGASSWRRFPFPGGCADQRMAGPVFSRASPAVFWA